MPQTLAGSCPKHTEAVLGTCGGPASFKIIDVGFSFPSVVIGMTADPADI